MSASGTTSLGSQTLELKRAGEVEEAWAIEARLSIIGWTTVDFETEARRLCKICLDMGRDGDADYSGPGLDLVAFEESHHWDSMYQLVESKTGTSTLDRGSTADWIIGSLHHRIQCLVLRTIQGR